MAKHSPKNKCGPGQPPEPHCSWISLPALPPLGTASRCYWSDSAPEGVPHLPVPLQNPIRENHLPQLCGGPAAQPTPRVSSRGGRNARATGSHSRAFPNFPWQFTLENCQLPPASPQIIVRQALRDPTFSMNPLSPRMLRAATAISSPLVQKLWRMCLPCGRLRKCEHLNFFDHSCQQ